MNPPALRRRREKRLGSSYQHVDSDGELPVPYSPGEQGLIQIRLRNAKGIHIGETFYQMPYRVRLAEITAATVVVVVVFVEQQ